MEINNVYLPITQTNVNSNNKSDSINNEDSRKTITMDTASPLENIGRSQVYISTSKYKNPERLYEQDIASFKPPEKYEPFFNQIINDCGYNPTMKIFSNHVGNTRFCFWASLCKYAPEKFEISLPLSELTFKSKEDFLNETLIFDVYNKILKMDTEKLKDLLSDIDEYNQVKIEEVNDVLSENDIADFINRKLDEEHDRLVKEGKIKVPTGPKYVVTRDKDAKDCTDPYITCSDQFHSDKMKEKLHKYLNQFEYIDDFNMDRGEKTPYMFDQVDISDNLAKNCRKLIEENKDKAQNVLISGNTNSYFTFGDKNLYEHIMGKEKLTLADAMMVMKYGDVKFQDEVVESIKNATVKDNNFKSFGVGRFCYNWMDPGSGNTCIFQSATLKAGCHGVHRMRGDQFEFIMSDDPKEITFQDVKYDPEEDVFYVDSTITCIK